MAVLTRSEESEISYSFLAEEYADQASLAMRCESTIVLPPCSTVVAGRLERFRRLMKKSLSYRDPAKILQAERYQSDLLGRLDHVIDNSHPNRQSSDLLGVAAP